MLLSIIFNLEAATAVAVWIADGLAIGIIGLAVAYLYQKGGQAK